MISTWQKHFASLLGPEGLRLIEPPNAAYAPHHLPLLHLIPDSKPKLIEVVRLAHRERIPLRPVGGNSSQKPPPSDEGSVCLLSTELLDSIVEHAAEDLTFTAEAGLSLADAQLHLAAFGQQLPLSPPNADRATLGGIVSAATEGPTLKAYGRVRDQVLGVELVTYEGQLTKAGGRVVKNVTGYDLCRLYTGARGHFGILTQITFRLRALERAGCTLVWTFDDASLALEAGRSLRREITDFFSLHLLSTPDSEGPRLIARIRGEEDFVEAVGTTAFAKSRGERNREILARESFDRLLTTPFDPLQSTSTLPSNLIIPDGPNLIDLETGLIRIPG